MDNITQNTHKLHVFYGMPARLIVAVFGVLLRLGKTCVKRARAHYVFGDKRRGVARSKVNMQTCNSNDLHGHIFSLAFEPTSSRF